MAYSRFLTGLLLLGGGVMTFVSFIIFFEARLSDSFAARAVTAVPITEANSAEDLCSQGYCQRPRARVPGSPQLAMVLSVPQTAGTTTLAFIGDIMFDRMVAERSRIANALAYPFARIGNLKRAFKADAVIANLEGPVGATRRAPEKTIDFLFDPRVVEMLKQEGVDAVSLANNHALDQGRSGLTEARDRLSRGGLLAFGDQVNDDATSSLRILRVQNRSVALLGFNVTDNTFDYADAESALVAARASASTIIVFVHWGREYIDRPTLQQIELGHWLVDHGVQAVIGSHPHWMESIEIYHARPIVYSLGNAVFDQDFSSETTFGLAVTLAFSSEATTLQLFPLSIVKSQPLILQGAARIQRLKRLAAISDPALTEQILSGQFRLLP